MEFEDFTFKQRYKGFTLIELLVVVAIIALLLAILLPSLHMAGIVTKRISCQSKLKQIALAWDMYLNDNKGQFYQNTNANLNYGGWLGMVGWSNRPLNYYLDLPANVESEHDAKIFCCPADHGGVPPEFSIREKAYNYLGTSYQTNVILIGQDQLLLLNDEFRTLHEEINKRMKKMNINRVDNPSSVLLIGDYGWYNQSKPAELPFEEWKTLAEWHSRKNCHNMAFLDNHVEFLNIRKGFYVTNEYSILPFQDLYGMALEAQTNLQ